MLAGLNEQRETGRPLAIGFIQCDLRSSMSAAPGMSAALWASGASLGAGRAFQAVGLGASCLAVLRASVPPHPPTHTSEWGLS